MIEEHYRRATTALARHVWDVLRATRADDRGELSSNVAWMAGLTLAALAVVGIVTAKLTNIANTLFP